MLPRQWDANGHARGKLAPGGWIAKADPEGKTGRFSVSDIVIPTIWTLINREICLLTMQIWNGISAHPGIARHALCTLPAGVSLAGEVALGTASRLASKYISWFPATVPQSGSESQGGEWTYSTLSSTDALNRELSRKGWLLKQPAQENRLPLQSFPKPRGRERFGLWKKSSVWRNQN